MSYTCPHCQSTVRVDCSQLPTGGGARVNCPSCSKAFTINADAASAAAAAADPGVAAWMRQELSVMREELRRELSLGAAARPTASASSFAAFAEQGMAALICEDDQAFATLLGDIVREIGYEPAVAPDAATAMALLSKTEYALVTIDGQLADDEEGGLKILAFLNQLPGARRRRTFVAFISANLRTMDTGSAFIHGANLTVNKEDARRLPEILKAGIAERDDLYRVYDEVTAKVLSGD